MISLIIGESLIRLLSLAPNIRELRVNIWEKEDDELNRGTSAIYKISDNKSLFYEPIKGVGAFNSEGYIGEVKDNNSKKKVLLIGDSVAFGVDNPWQRNIGYWLEYYFENSLDLYNFAVPGYSIKQYKEVLKREIQKRKFDFVLFAVCVNDFESTSSEFIELAKLIEKKGLSYISEEHQRTYTRGMDYIKIRKLLNNSHLYLYLSQLFKLVHFNSFDFIQADQMLFTDETLLNTSIEIRRTLEQNQLDYLFALLPHNSKYYQERYIKMEDILTKANIKFYNLHEKVVQQNLNDDNHYVDELHYSPSGVKLITEILSKKLKSLLSSIKTK